MGELMENESGKQVRELGNRGHFLKCNGGRLRLASEGSFFHQGGL